MKEGSSIETHLKHMKEVTEKLAAIGAPIEEEDQVVTLLGSLPSSYSTLLTALEARVDNIKLDFVQQALMNEDLKLKTHSQGEQQDSALLGKFRRPLRPGYFKCYHYGQAEHFCIDCQRRRQHLHKAKLVGDNAQEKPHKNADKRVQMKVPLQLHLAQRNHHSWTSVIDSGASSHITSQRELLTDYCKFERPEKVGLGDVQTVDAVGTGNAYKNMQMNDGERKQCVIYKALYVPKLACNLFSVRAAAAKGKSMKFCNRKCFICSRANNVCGTGTLVGKPYQLNCKPIASDHVSVASEKTHEVDLWHQIVGHLGMQSHH